MSGLLKEKHSVKEDNIVVENDMASKDTSFVKLLICFAGIFVSYFVYGLLQETITKGKYGEGDGTEKFTFTLALVCFQCVINALFAKIVMMVTQPPRDTSPQKMYAAMSFSYLSAMVASMHALQYVAYPTQVLGKSVKPIPIMILGVLVARKRYPLRKYLFVFLIVIGVAIFTYKDKKSSSTDHAMGWGELLLVVSLLMDGITGGIQDKIRAEYTTQTHRMMFNLNAWSVVYLTVALLLTGEGIAFTVFATKYPAVLLNLMAFSLCSAVGQHFIFVTVTTFGPLTCSIITTTRKFFTILGSVLLFGHPMFAQQWVGTVFVFIGLFLDNMYGKEKKPAKE